MSYKDEEQSNVMKVMLTQDIMASNNVIITEDTSQTIEVQHSFQQEEVFPDLQERRQFKDIDPESTGVLNGDLHIEYATDITINVVESGAGYNNTLGAYTVAADGTIQAAEFAFTNVKDSLNTQKRIERIERDIGKNEVRIDKLEDQIEHFTNKGADKHANKIEKLAERIESYRDGNDALTAEKASLQANLDYTYSYAGDSGTSFGVFIVANGDRINKDYNDIDLENGSLEFIYDLGGSDERLAKVTDTAEQVTLVHRNGDEITIINGNIYHTTPRGRSTAINPDNAEHVLAGLVDANDPSALRLGFEDLKNLGDADYNDVVIDIKVGSGTKKSGTDDNEVLGGREDNLFIASLGNDTINGGQGIDTIDYSAASTGLVVDLKNGYMTDDTGKRDTLIIIENIIATNFADRLNGSDVDNVILAEAGNDTVQGLAGDDTLYGGDGDDLIYGDYQTEASFDGNDVLYGEEGNDRLIGGGGNDILNGGAGDDIINGGSGIDTVDYSTAVTAVTTNLNSALGLSDNGERDTLISIENIEGSEFNDRLLGGNGDNEISGNGGADVIQGLTGNDTLSGGLGDDVIYGDYNTSETGIDGNDVLFGNEGNDTLIGRGGDDILNGGSGANKLYGGTGADTFVFNADASDVVYDFSSTEGDTLDITDIISDAYTDPASQAINDFVDVTFVNGTTRISVDADGGGDNYVQVATVVGSLGTTDVQTLEDNGTLITI